MCTDFREHADDSLLAGFYAVTGSHIYGFASVDSDVDVRGFHVADGRRYALLNEPQEQYIINQGNITQGYEEYENIDLVSYELKKFTSLLYKSNFNILELLFCGDTVIDSTNGAIHELRRIISEELPLNVPKTYHGMAKSNYHKFLNPNRDSFQPTAKKYLYVLRGLLAAQYVSEEREIESDIRELAKWHGEYYGLVGELIEIKFDHEHASVDYDLRQRAEDAIQTLFDEGEYPQDYDKTSYREKLNNFTLKARAL